MKHHEPRLRGGANNQPGGETPPPVKTLPGFTAQRSGTCPLCTKYITKNRSRIDALEVPLRPSTEVAYFDPYDEEWRERWGKRRPISMHPRRWAHANCKRRYDRATAGQDHTELVKRRNAELVRHKNEALGTSRQE